MTQVARKPSFRVIAAYSVKFATWDHESKVMKQPIYLILWPMIETAWSDCFSQNT